MATYQKRKVCIDCGFRRVIWSNGRCKDCAGRVSAKIKQQFFTDQKKADMDFYWDCWNHRENDKCQSCGDMIYTPQTFNFHHLLEKSKYPLLRYDPANIAIVCWQCHNQIHTMSGRIICFDDRIAELKQKVEN
jgi:5-methylcytosine-specific restriction endonuclease McrA